MPDLFDSIELIVDLPEKRLYAGMEGAIVEVLRDGVAYEVEFDPTDDDDLNLHALEPDQFIVVWRNATREPVPLADQIAQIVARLPQEAATEVLDFARYLSVRAARRRQEPIRTLATAETS